MRTHRSYSMFHATQLRSRIISGIIFYECFLTQSEKSPTSKLRCRWGLCQTILSRGTSSKRSAGCARIRIGSESAKADPNPARKTRERVLTPRALCPGIFHCTYILFYNEKHRCCSCNTAFTSEVPKMFLSHRFYVQRTAMFL